MASKDSISSYLRKIFSLAVAAGLFFATIELCARIDDRFRYGAPFSGKYDASILRSYDKDGIRHNVPNASFEKWKINNYGFRGKDITIGKADGTQRVVCLGTSETFGLYEKENNEWPAQLMRILEPEKKFEIINASVVGMGLEHYRRYIDRYVMPFSPDFIILIINPYFYISHSVREHPRKTEDTVESSRPNHAEGGDINDRKLELRVVEKIKNGAKMLLPEGILKRYQRYQMTRQVENVRRAMKTEVLADDAAETDVRLFQGDVAKLVDFIEAKRIRPVLCSYPVLINAENRDLYPEIFLDGMRYSPGLSLSGMINAPRRLNSALQAVAEKRDIVFVDNYHLLPQVIENFGDNVHYSDIGANIVAKNFARVFRP